MQIGSLPQLSYNLSCNLDFTPVYFEWGQLILTLMATLLLILGTFYARIKALSAIGVDYNIKWIVGVTVVMLGINFIVLFEPSPGSIIIDVVSWGLGLVCSSVVTL